MKSSTALIPLVLLAGLVASRDVTATTISSTPGGSCNGYPHPVEATRTDGSAQVVAPSGIFAAPSVICSIPRNSSMELDTVSVVVEGAQACTLYFGSPEEDVENGYNYVSSQSETSSDNVGDFVQQDFVVTGTDRAEPFVFLVCTGPAYGSVSVVGYETAEEPRL